MTASLSLSVKLDAKKYEWKERMAAEALLETFQQLESAPGRSRVGGLRQRVA
jgi:hypothetical protein